MATLQDLVQQDQTLNRNQFATDKGLVREVQIRLRNLGLYPGGPWIDGLLGGTQSLTWKGLQQFCQAVDLGNLPSEQIGINPSIATQLLQTKQLPFIFDQAKNTAFILEKLSEIQRRTPASSAGVGVDEAFVARTLTNSPFESELNNFPQYLAQQPDQINLVSYGPSVVLNNSGQTVTFTDYPERGQRPNLNTNGLNFLDSNISEACLCVGSFVQGQDDIKVHWVGRNALQPAQFLSATKFIGVLNTIAQINQQFPNTDIDNCVIGTTPDNRRPNFFELMVDMVSYRKERLSGGLSNQIGALFRRFSTRSSLETWIRNITGNSSLQFRGYYGFPPLIASPSVFDTTLTSNQIVLRSAAEVGNGNNSISAYDLVRLISMLGWHLHLKPSSQLPRNPLDTLWNSLESLVRAMGRDPARYVDVALETLGVINVISEPVVISKVGFSTTSAYTYVAFVKFVDHRRETNGQLPKLRTLALALRTSAGSQEDRDTRLAAAVTEILWRILTEELA